MDETVVRMKSSWVYVCCGSSKHIETLNFSLSLLQSFTAHEIVVVTDLSRNETEIEHTNIVDVKTPAELNDKQAAIFLKTSLHRYLDPEGRYCYLDSDVLAVRDGIDSIFEHYVPPITFAPDLCSLQEFSPYAVRCEKSKKLQDDHQKIKAIADSPVAAQASEERFRALLSEFRNKPRGQQNTLVKLFASLRSSLRAR